jgi:NAD(P)-dependent dehydrogenase (short-subunit alcohol dehydrogenase family)
VRRLASAAQLPSNWPAMDPKSSSSVATSRGAETADAIISEDGRARFVAADLSNPADLRRLVEDIDDIDILVNNAGFSWFGATADLEIDYILAARFTVSSILFNLVESCFADNRKQ